jgi:hypothetical protein
MGTSRPNALCRTQGSFALSHANVHLWVACPSRSCMRRRLNLARSRIPPAGCCHDEGQLTSSGLLWIRGWLSRVSIPRPAPRGRERVDIPPGVVFHGVTVGVLSDLIWGT